MTLLLGLWSARSRLMFFDILTESTPTKIGLFCDMGTKAPDIGVTMSENSDICSDDRVVCSCVVVLVDVVVDFVVDVVVVVVEVDVVVDVVVLDVVVVVVVVEDCTVVVVGIVVVVGLLVGRDVVIFSAIAMKDGKSPSNEVIVVADL